MTSRSVRLRLSFVGTCLWVMLTMREIQGYPYRQLFWNSLYNNQIRPMSNAAQFPRYYPYVQYPYRFPGAPILGNVQWQPYAYNPQLRKDQRPTGNGRWINSGNGFANGFAGTINFQPVMPMIVFPTTPQQATFQREQETSRWNEKAAPVEIEKNKESSTDRVSSTTECSVFQETTQPQQAEENLREESPGGPVELDRESVPPACQGNCENAGKDDISILIEEALRNGELLRSDEWIRWQNAMKRKSERQEEEDTRKESTSGPAELDRGPASSCRGDCADNSGSDTSKIIDEILGDDEWLGKQDAARRDKKRTRKPPDERELYSGPAPVCSNSTFCVHATDYPEELVNRAIRRNDGLRLLQSVDPVSEVGDRLEFDELNDSPFCGSYTRLIYPRSAETMDRRWLFVVNQDNLRQGVRIEVCAKEGSVCGDLDDYLPGGYRAFCKQKYIYRELVAVDEDGIVKKETFRFPSSCCCHREFR